jgi:hypothetical protein
MDRFSKILRVMPVVLFIIGRWVFDAFSPSISDFAEITLINNSPMITSWQVFYYITLDLSWLLHLLNLRLKENVDNYKSFYSILGLSFLIDIYFNISKIGMDFDEYVVSITNYEQNILTAGLICALLLILLVKILSQLKSLTWLKIKNHA